MKRILLALLAAVLCLAVTACSGNNTPVSNDPPVDTSPLTTAGPQDSASAQPTATDPAQSASPSASLSGEPSPSVSPTTSVDPSASASASPAATASGSQNPYSTPAPSSQYKKGNSSSTTDYADLDAGYSNKTSLSDAVKSATYVVLVTVNTDLGVRNVLTGTPTGELAPNAILNHWEYTVTVDEVLKTSSNYKITKGESLVYSQPFEIKMKSSQPLQREEPFAQLITGKQYLLLLGYDDYYAIYTPASMEPNKFSVDSSGKLTYVTGMSDYVSLWNSVAGTSTLDQARSASK